MKNKNDLDKFYTNPLVSDMLVADLFKKFPSLSKRNIIEPSAGSGNFINSLLLHNVKSQQIKAYDIDPLDHSKIKKQNYLELKIKYDYNNLVIGNPPFGKNAKLALDFLNKALSEASVVAFILPKTFKRYSIQKKVNSKAKLIYEKILEPKSFLVNNHEYAVNCVFQVWSLPEYETYQKNIRLKNPKSFKNDDFDAFIHNNTKETQKYFDKKKYKWNFAIHRQGYYDYKKKIIKSEDLIKNRQYLFIKIKNVAAKEIFKAMDFEELSHSNTSVRGFSLTDLVEKYKYFKKIWIMKEVLEKMILEDFNKDKKDDIKSISFFKIRIWEILKKI